VVKAHARARSPADGLPWQLLGLPSSGHGCEETARTQLGSKHIIGEPLLDMRIEPLHVWRWPFEPLIPGAVQHKSRSAMADPQCIAIDDVAPLDGQTASRASGTGRADQDPHIVATFDELPGNVRAQESAGTDHQHLFVQGSCVVSVSDRCAPLLDVVITSSAVPRSRRAAHG